MKNFPVELKNGDESISDIDKGINIVLQSIEEVTAIMQEARGGLIGMSTNVEGGNIELDDDTDIDSEMEDDTETSGDYVCAL